MAVLWQNLPTLGPGPRGHILREKNVQVLHQQNLKSISEPLGPEQAQTEGLGYISETGPSPFKVKPTTIKPNIVIASSFP